jgi:phage nucleotide-binding protein
MINIKSTKNYSTNGVKILIYGPAGAGKTRLCATAPNPLIISAESGLLSLSDEDIPFVNVSTVEDVNDIYSWVIGSKEAEKYDTLCLDSVTEIAEVLLTTFKAEEKDPRAAYGRLADEMSKMIRSFRDLKGKNVYFTAKQATLTDDIGVTSFVPLMPGKTLLNGLPFFFDEVLSFKLGKLEDGTVYSYLQTVPDRQRDCKDRSGRLLPKEEPHLGRIFDKISGSKPTVVKTKE